MNLLLLIVILIPVFISLIFIPFWTRKTESFGVTIPEEAYHRADIKGMRKKYAWMTGLLAAAITIAFLFISGGKNENFISILFTIFISAYIFASYSIYWMFHRQMKELKAKNKDWMQKQQLVTVDTGFRSQKLTHSNFWFVIPFLISIVTIIITLTNYQQIPDRFPVKYSFSGDVTDWAHKSYRSVLLLPIMQNYLTLLLLFLNTVISKAKQQVSAANPQVSLQQNVIFRRRWSLFIIFMGIGLVGMLMLHQLSIIYPINQRVLTITPIVFTIAILAASILLSITTGQGGSRIKIKGIGSPGKIINRDDDQYWKLGLFYFNKNDPALFVEKRFGIGWTNNFAHPLSWIILIVIILLIIVLPKSLG